MVLKLREYPNFLLCYSYKNLPQRKGMVYSERKHLSDIVPAPSTPSTQSNFPKPKKNILKLKFDELVKWYDEFTGMDEVRHAQNRVLQDEQKFRVMQEKRRHVLNELKVIQNRLKDLYAELDNTNRGEEKYVHLVTEEHKLLKEERAILDKFSTAEKLERDAFSALSTSVKLSHEKERAQGERTKYWSIIGSVMGTVIGIVGTSMNNHFRMKELKALILKTSDNNLIESLNTFLENNEKLLLNFKEEKALQTNTVSYEDLLKNLNLRLDKMEYNLSKLEKISRETVKIEQQIESFGAPVDSLADTIEKEQKQTKIILCALAVLSILMPVISKYT